MPSSTLGNAPSTPGMSPARTTQLTICPEESIHLLHISCPTYPSPQSYAPSSQTLTLSSPLQALISTSHHPPCPSPAECFQTTSVPRSTLSLTVGGRSSSHVPPTVNQERRAWNKPLPASSSSEKRTWPAPYRKNLVPLPSPLRPHCPANQRLRLWRPLAPRDQHASQVSDEDLKRIQDVMAHAWELDTHVTYTSGLLNFMVFCYQKNIPEKDRAPASQLLIMSFVSALAAAYSGSAISNYIYGVRAWHLLHSVPWKISKPELEALLKAAEKLTPSSSMRKKRRPYTIDFMLAIRKNMDLSMPLGASAFACLATCFFATGHVGQFTIQRLDSFNPKFHISKNQLSYDQNREGQQVTVLHLPHTKASPQGEDVCWAKQDRLMNPNTVLAHHLEVNDPPQDGHLFAYRHKNGHRPLTKSKFLAELARAACTAGLEPLQGHGIRIGLTLEYLLRGVPFDVMKVKGHWSSDTFTLYLSKHVQILVPYIQAAPAVHDAFVHLTMPPVR